MVFHPRSRHRREVGMGSNMIIKCPACGKETHRDNSSNGIAGCGLIHEDDEPIYDPDRGCGHLFYYDANGSRARLDKKYQTYMNDPAHKPRTERFLSQVREYYWG